MKLTDIIAKLTGLTTKVEALADTAVKAELVSLQGLVSNELTEATNKLTTAEASVKELTGKVTNAESAVTNLTNELNAVKTALTGALGAFKTEATGTATEMVVALQNSVTSTLTKLHVPKEQIPNPAVKETAGSDAKVKSRVEFEKLGPVAKMQFFKQGGKLTE